MCKAEIKENMKKAHVKKIKPLRGGGQNGGGTGCTPLNPV